MPFIFIRGGSLSTMLLFRGVGYRCLFVLCGFLLSYLCARVEGLGSCVVERFEGIQIHDRHPFTDLTNRGGIDADACSQWCCGTAKCEAFFHTTNQLSDAGNCKKGASCCWLKPTFNESRLGDKCETETDCVSGRCRRSVGPEVTISNIHPRTDRGGEIMDAHDSKMLLLDGVYHWYAASYGECTEPKGANGCSASAIGDCGFKTDHNVTLFTSIDLVTWANCGVVFSATGNLPPQSVLFAPKTVFNKITQEYVMWFNYIVGDFSKSYYGVATSKTSSGPFEIQVHNVNTTQYKDNGDENLFVDDDGTGYLIYTSIAQGHGISIEKLTPDFKGTLGARSSSGIFGVKLSEAPALFKRQGVYYAVFGTCCCYCGAGSEVNVYTSTTGALGPYTKRTSLGQLHSQSTDIFRYVDSDGKEQFMYIGDHWQSAPDRIKGHDFTVWAKLDFSQDGLQVTTNGFQGSFNVSVWGAVGGAV